MFPRPTDRWLPGLLVALLAVACATLAWLQYRWTGDLGRVEAEQLRSGVDTRLRKLTRDFDADLSRAAHDFLPTARELDTLGWQAAHVERWRQATARNDRPFFRRHTVAVPNPQGDLDLFDLTPNGPQPIAWPPSFVTLHENLGDLVRNGRMPRSIVDPESDLVEIPVFGGPRGQPGRGEREWGIFELDTQYFTQAWLPQLIEANLGDFAVRITRPSGQAVYGQPETRRPEATGTMFALRGLDAGPGGGPPGPRGRGPRGGNDNGRWRISVQHPAGSIEIAVASARRRNLALALALVALIAAAGFVLLRYTLRLRQLADLQFRFVAGVSHDLRTPLTVIRGAGHNLLSGVVTGEAQREDYLRLIVRHADELTKMVEQLLAYGAARHQAAPPALEAVSVSDALSAAIDNAELTSLDLDVPADLPPVRAERASLERVFQNLLANAAKHGGGQVEISARAAGGMVEVRFADRGPGIPPEDLPFLFDPFYRGQRARDQRIRGTGLGLSLVRDTIAGFGGQITAESANGAIFTIRLPEARP